MVLLDPEDLYLSYHEKRQLKIVKFNSNKCFTGDT